MEESDVCCLDSGLLMIDASACANVFPLLKKQRGQVTLALQFMGGHGELIVTGTAISVTLIGVYSGPTETLDF
jgi:hypothetical protein